MTISTAVSHLVTEVTEAFRNVLVKLRVLEARVVAAPSVVAAVASLHKAVEDLEAVALHHNGLSAAADRAINAAAIAKLKAEQEVEAARKVAGNLKALLG